MFVYTRSYLEYLYDQDTQAFGGSSSLKNLQQIAVLLAICLLTIQFVKRQITT